MKWISDIFAGSPLPTSEIYGLAPGFRCLKGSKCRMGESYGVGNSVVAVRLARPASSGKALFLLMDDDLSAAIEDPSLPAGYRQRLASSFSESVVQKQWNAVRAVLVPSQRLEDIYRNCGKQVIRIDPTWPVPQVRRGRKSTSGNEVAFLGTRSHAGDLELLRTALESPARSWTFHHFFGTHAPDWLARLPQVVPHRPLSWESYRDALPRMSFDLCVYPCRPTPVNEARSFNKLLEHAMAGAPALYSACVPFAEHVERMADGLLVEDDQWGMKVEWALRSAGELEALATASHDYAFRLANEARAAQTGIWESILCG